MHADEALGTHWEDKGVMLLSHDQDNASGITCINHILGRVVGL